MKAKKVTSQQRANALFARDVMWPSVPPKNVAPKLAYWARGLNGEKRVPNVRHPIRVATCGTIACFGGWCAQNPHFQAQGVYPEFDGSPKNANGWPPQVSWVLFGDASLFEYRRGKERGTSHEIVTKRLDDLIRNSEVES